MSNGLRTKPASNAPKQKKWDKRWITKEVFVPIIVAIIGCIGVVVGGILGSSQILQKISISPTPPLILQPQITPFANKSGDKIFFLQNNDYFFIGLYEGIPTIIAKNPQAFVSCPSISPDGELILFTSNIEGHTDIYIVNRDGTNLRNVTNSNGYDEICGAWSPDQKRILFYRQYSISSDILIIDVDGRNETNITNTFNDDQGVLNTIAETPWSPDGDKFAFQSDRDGDFDIYIYDFSTKQTIKATDTSRDEYKAAWSPKGDKIAYTGVIEKDDYDIFVLDVSTMVLPAIGINLTNNPAHDTDCTWSPNGTELVFISDRAGNGEIYIMDVNGNNILKLTNTPEGEQRPRWIH